MYFKQKYLTSVKRKQSKSRLNLITKPNGSMIFLEYTFFLPNLASTLPTLPAPKELHSFVPRKKGKVEVHPTLCNLMDWSLPGSSVPGILQAKYTGVGCHFLLQGIFPTQGSNPCFQHCRQILYPLRHQESPQERQCQIRL